MSEKILPGTLYIVSTPIGNLDDITRRAVFILGGVDLIAAEDTRTTRILLDHLGIQKPLVSYFMHNEKRRIPDLLQKLTHGLSVAVVTDAGTPGISDPAFALIRAAVGQDTRVIPIPGASAIMAGLVASGLPTDRFVFEGFLPHKKGRKTRLTFLRAEQRTIVFYEAPHRIERTLGDLAAHFGDRKAALGRELTKKFEEIRRGTLQELLESVRSTPPKGEMVIIVAGNHLPESEDATHGEEHGNTGATA